MRSRSRNLFTLLVWSLCVPAFFVPKYLLETGHNPPVGVYIAIMGGLAAYVTFREKIRPAEKAAWIVLITLIIVAEIRNIYVSDAEQASKFGKISDALDATKKGLDATASGIDATVANGQTQFQETMKRSNQMLVEVGKIAGLSEDSIGSITGGDSFVYFRLLPTENPAVTLVWEIHHGHYPLHDVMARIVDVDQATKVLTTKPLDLAALRRTDIAYLSVPMLTPIHSANQYINYTLAGTESHRFSVFFSGPNGDWSEELRGQLVNGTWSWAIRVMQQKVGEKRPRFFYEFERYPIKPKDIDWNH